MKRFKETFIECFINNKVSYTCRLKLQLKAKVLKQISVEIIQTYIYIKQQLHHTNLYNSRKKQVMFIRKLHLKKHFLTGFYNNNLSNITRIITVDKCTT